MEKNQFFSLLILYSAPTLTGIKSASLFGCRMDTRQALERHVRDASRRLKGCGIWVLLLSYQNGRGKGCDVGFGQRHLQRCTG